MYNASEVTIGHYSNVHCKYTLLYAIKKLFVPTTKHVHFVQLWNTVSHSEGRTYKCLGPVPRKMLGIKRDGVGNGECYITRSSVMILTHCC
jgi:hypothetical protein